jgi:alkyl hydroperoxide reductase subunit AhpF
MRLLSERDADAVRQRLQSLARPVRLEFFTESASGLIIPGRECRSCPEAQRLLEDLASCSPLLSLRIHDRIGDPEAFAAYGIDKVPATAVVGDEDDGVRYYGMPAGYEFSTLLDVLLDVASGDPPLAPETKAALRDLPAPVHLQVLVTPT